LKKISYKSICKKFQPELDYVKALFIIATRVATLISNDCRKLFNQSPNKYILIAGRPKNETTILIASKTGVTNISESILEHFPVAIQDMNADKKNIMMLTVQNMGKGKTKFNCLF
jgi:hypothetical protein